MHFVGKCSYVPKELVCVKIEKLAYFGLTWLYVQSLRTD
jgi:hypothetical protein